MDGNFLTSIQINDKTQDTLFQNLAIKLKKIIYVLIVKIKKK